ncbi:MAG: MMPL family transporter, partial [Burkholderiales bacterium]
IRTAYSASEPPAGARLILAGPSVFAVRARADIEGDAWRLSLVATSLVLLLLAWVYRSAPLVIAGALPVVTGVAVGVAAVALGFGAVHGITLGFGATLIGEAVDYSTYLFLHQRRDEAMAAALARIWPTLRLAVLTTVFSGFTMLASSFQGLAQLGVLLVVGILVAGLVTRWVLPALDEMGLERFTRSKLEALPAVLDPRRLQSLPRMSTAFAIGLTLVAAAYLVQQGEALWDDDLESLSPISAEQKNLDGALRTELGAPDVRYLIAVTARAQEAALQASEALQAPLSKLVEAGAIAGFDMAALFLPSDSRQTTRRAALPTPERLGAALDAALDGLPFKPEVFKPFLAAVEATRGGLALTRADLDRTSIGLRVRSLLTEHDGEWTALVPLASVADARALRTGLAPYLGEATMLLDLKAESNAMVASYRGESLRLTGLGLLAIVGVLVWGLRGIRPVARILAPVVAAVVLDVAALTLLGVRLSLFHLVALLLVVGVGLNYALFFGRPEPNPREQARTTLSLVVCALTTLAAFGALATSAMPVLRAIGLTVSLGIVLSFALAALFAPRSRIA